MSESISAEPMRERWNGDLLESLIQDCQSRQPISVAVCWPCSAVSLTGAVEATKSGLICPVFVGKGGAPLLVMGTHAFGGMERFLLGSTAEEVLRQAHCPVVTVGPQTAFSTKDGPHLQNILYATDFSEASLAAVPFLAALQKSTGAQLRILHVAADHDSGTGEERKRFDPVRRLLGVNEDEEYVVLHGTNVAQAVVNEAERRPADLVVLGVKHASAFVAHAAPKIAFQIVAASPCPVLTVAS